MVAGLLIAAFVSTHSDSERGFTIMIAIIVSFIAALSGIIVARESNDEIMSKLIEIEKKLNLVKPDGSSIDPPSENSDARSIPKYICVMSATYVFAGIMLIINLPDMYILGVVFIVFAIWQTIESIVNRN